MKKNLMIAAGVALLTLSACKDKAAEENIANDNAATEVDTTATAPAQDTAAVAQPEDAIPENEVKTVKGDVTEIVNGKDGYTATIKDMGGNVVDVVISIPNLKDPKQFRRVNVGDKIKATGEHYMVGDKHTVKADSFQ